MTEPFIGRGHDSPCCSGIAHPIATATLIAAPRPKAIARRSSMERFKPAYSIPVPGHCPQ